MSDFDIFVPYSADELQREDALDRRQREKREAAEKRKKEEAKQQARQQVRRRQRAQEWTAWFRRELANEDELHKAIGSCIADVKREIIDQSDRKFAALKQENAELKAENVSLQRRVEKLEAEMSVHARFTRLERDLPARQLAINEAKRGDKGKPGAPGAPGKRGERGEKGEKGERGAAAPKLHSIQVDREKYRMVLLFDDGTSWEPLNFRPFLEQFLIDHGFY